MPRKIRGCTLPGCDAREKAGLSTFCYPKAHNEMCDKWISIFEKVYGKYHKNFDYEEIFKGSICSQHFEENYMITSQTKRGIKRFLTFNAYPSIFSSINHSKLEPEEEIIEPRITRGRNKLEVTYVEANEDDFDDNSVKNENFSDEELEPPTKYEKCCRLCLDNSESSNILTDSTAEKVETLINQTLKRSSKYPNRLCKKCEKNITKFIEFRNTILRNQEKLAEEIPDVEIKEELRDEDFDDFFDNTERSPVDDHQTSKGAFEEPLVKIEACVFDSNIKCEDYKMEKDSNESILDNTTVRKEDTDSDESVKSWMQSPKIRRNRKYGSMTWREYNHMKISCEKCDKKVRIIEMKRHIACYHDKNNCKFECDACGRKFFDKRGVRDHLDRRHRLLEDKVRCKYCSKLVRPGRSMLGHIRRMHKEGKPTGVIMCDECGCVVKDQATLKIHIIKAHKKLREIKCDHPKCGKAFHTVSELNNHKKYVHSGPKKCEFCHVMCTSVSSYKKHILKHSNTNYRCQYFVNGVQCSISCPDLGRLKVHQRVHSDDRAFVCSTCSADFKSKSSLKNHYLSKHSEFKMNCPVEMCCYTYLRKYRLKDHVKQYHAQCGEIFIREMLQKVDDFRIPNLDELKKIT